jgi:hypothetical protein
MRMKTIGAWLVAGVVTWAAPVDAGTWNGTVKLGGVVLDEEGDLSAVQETENIYDGFSVTEVRLHGTPDMKNYFNLDLQEVNLDSRRGRFVYRMPGALKLNASFNRSRQVFDPQRLISSEREHWDVGVRLTPTKWFALSGSFDNTTREGDRLSFPSGTVSVLGTGYDYALRTGRLGAEVRKGRRGLEVALRMSDFSDDLNAAADRTGRVVSARLYGPCMFTDKWMHYVRGAYGVSEVSNVGGALTDIDYKLYSARYTGIVRPVDRFQATYTFDAQRVDNESTDLDTDRFQNRIAATFYHPHGSITGGYAYEINDDDRTLTSYNSWQAATTFRYQKRVTAKIRYAGRVKTDLEELTLLRDIESSRLRADLEVVPIDGLALGGGFNIRDREYPDIEVKSEGQSFRATARYTIADWGGVSGDFTHSTDEYTDRVAGFEATTDVVSARVDFERVQGLRLSSGLTYVDASEDLDIEKSIWSFEGQYDVFADWGLEVKYNVFNYDDYVLLDRYYTANVVRFNVVYDLPVQ